MNKYFLVNAAAGCLLAIAVSSLATELGRVFPSIWQGFAILWGVTALFFGAWLRFNEDDFDGLERLKNESLYLLINALVVLGVCFGKY